MAIRYDPRLYTAGTAVFNPEPLTRASEYVARYKQAKNDAIDQYYQKRADSINGAGMRNQDLPAFNEKIQQLKDYYLVNKDKLRKGDVMAQSNYEKMFRDTMGVVQQSKNRTAKAEQLGQIALKQREEGGAPTDEMMQAIHMNDLPLNDPNSREIDPNYFLSEPKPFDLQKTLKTFEDVPRTPGVPVIGETDQKTGKRLVTQTESFDDQAKDTIALRAGNAYQNDRSFQREINKNLANPAIKEQLGQLYEQQYGKAPDHNEDYAAAYILSQKQLTKSVPKWEDDKEWLAQQKQKLDLAKISFKNKLDIARDAMKAKTAKDLAKYRHDLKGLDKKEEGNVLDQTFADIEEDAKKNGEHNLVAGGKVIGKNYVASVPDIIKGELGRKDASGKLQYPNQVVFNPDNTIRIIYFKKDKDGNTIQGHIDNSASHTITRNQFKALIGKKLFGVKTTSGADYGEDDGFDDEEDNDEQQIVPASKPLAQPKVKIPGF